MKAYYWNGESVYWVDFSENEEIYFMIHEEDSRRITLKKWMFKSDFVVNQGDKFYEHNSLIYIRKSDGDIVSADGYQWNNILIRDCYYIFEEMFGSPVQATQLNQHAKIVGI